jgi:hydrogenase maturation factor
MCLTIPKKVISVNNDFIKLSRQNKKNTEKAGSILKVKKGDWVLTQNGIIVSKITSRQAREINKLFNNN